MSEYPAIDDLVKATSAGWPRRFLPTDGTPARLPLPWINGAHPILNGRRGWVELNELRLKEAEKERLCFCCGEALNKTLVMGRHRASFPRDEDEPGSPIIWLTDGPGGHPRCMALAAQYCPHLTRQHQGDPDFRIALAWAGEGPGYVRFDGPEEGGARLLCHVSVQALTLGQLRALASADPLGLEG
jgi:hypothetical protein